MPPSEQLALALERFASIPERARTENVKRVVSPAGKWFIAGDDVEAAAFRRRNKGAAVFTRTELDGMRPKLQRIAPNERQTLLGALIAVKSVFGAAKVESITFRETEEQKRRRARWEDF